MDTWPPRADPSQWVYFPGVDAARANGDPRSTMDMVQHADSIEPLLAGRVPPSFPVAAVTTDGKLLRTLRPQWAWRELGDWGRGLYVKESVARTMQLREPRVDMTPEERGARRQGMAAAIDGACEQQATPYLRAVGVARGKVHAWLQARQARLLSQTAPPGL